MSAELTTCLGCRPFGPYGVERATMLFLRDHFSGPASDDPFLGDLLGCKVKYPDGMWVGMENEDEGTDEAREVSVTVSVPQGVVLKKEVVNDEAGRSEDTASTYYNRSANFKIGILHRHKRASVVKLLAESTSSAMQAFRVHLLDLELVRGFEIDGWTSPQKERESEQPMYGTLVGVTVTMDFVTEVRVESHRLKRAKTTIGFEES